MITWVLGFPFRSTCLDDGSCRLVFVLSRLNISTESNGEQCIAELRYKAGLFEEAHCVEVLQDVIKSDNIVLDELRKELQSAVSPLENVPDREKDWHPVPRTRFSILSIPRSLRLCMGKGGSLQTIPLA